MIRVNFQGLFLGEDKREDIGEGDSLKPAVKIF